MTLEQLLEAFGLAYRSVGRLRGAGWDAHHTDRLSDEIVAFENVSVRTQPPDEQNGDSLPGH